MLNKTHRFFGQNADLIFLFALIFLLFFSAFFSSFANVLLYERLMQSAIIISSIYLIRRNGRRRITTMAMIMGPVSLICIWIQSFHASPHLDALGRISFFSVYGLVLVYYFRIIFRSEKVGLRVIVASITGYIILGLMGAWAVGFVNEQFPGAYNIVPTSKDLNDVYTYYSFVTMTTLGYGDITPQLPQSRSLAIILSLAGQFYMTILIALLIGKYLQSSKE